MTSLDTRYEIRDTTDADQPEGKPQPVGGRATGVASSAIVVAVVGPCASGKSTLVAALKAAGYDARHPAQEHSFVKDMWQRLVDPDVLIYLDVSHEAYRQRRPKDDAGPEYLEMQRGRLAHAREHADLVVDTSGLTAGEVWAAVAGFLERGPGYTDGGESSGQ